MLKVESIEIEKNIDAGCNNGNYPRVTIHTTQGDFHGLTCACHRGCSNTWDVTGLEGKSFKDSEELLEWVTEEEN